MKPYSNLLNPTESQIFSFTLSAEAEAVAVRKLPETKISQKSRKKVFLSNPLFACDADADDDDDDEDDGSKSHFSTKVSKFCINCVRRQVCQVNNGSGFIQSFVDTRERNNLPFAFAQDLIRFEIYNLELHFPGNETVETTTTTKIERQR